ncbi:unnamed protein product [Somion occarium]|uniref:PABS domain-containing protein n=2 Tax=Somion occarium TaxID=3059160 RepID=A0ABP1D000_9APHY
MPNPAGPPEKSVLASAVANTLSILTLVTLSFVIFEYQRLLEPLYATAPVEYHLNKVIWSACILGSFAPTLPNAAVLAAGILAALLPTSAYWVAAYTGRYHDVIWGPVVTHLLVLAPILYLGVGIVKASHESPDGNVIVGAGGAQVMSLPVCGMALTSLRELWSAVPYIHTLDETLTLSWIGGFAITLWLLMPFFTLQGNATVPTEQPTPNPPESLTKKERKQRLKADAVAKTAVTNEPPKPKDTHKPTESAKSHAWRVMILPIIPLLITFGKPPTLPKPLPEPFTHPTAPLRVLSSVRSIYSGVILVGEVLPPTPEAIETGNVREPHSIRYLRAGHSLLGGVWIGNRVYRRDGQRPLAVDRDGTPLGDSIYGTFNLQEAVRLVDMPEVSTPKNALIIGLGAGISASAFMHHNVSTTIVEIDPAVYEAAEHFFALPKPQEGHLFLEDAREWVHRRRNQLKNPEASSDTATKSDSLPLFDYVVHDCFSGGGLPGHIFTIQFWEDLKAIISPSGVVAVNFAGKMGSSSSRAIVTTLKKAFGQCRAFHDSMEPLTEEQLRTEFVNWVFFCTHSSKPLRFRPPKEEDYLTSYLRERVLSTLPEHEVAFDMIMGDTNVVDESKYVLTDSNNPLIGWQQVDALHHWVLMRQVLPDVFWETY